MGNTATALMHDGDLYDLTVEVVGDETSLEFVTLSDYYLDNNDLDLAMRANGTDWETIKPLVDEIDSKAQERMTE